MDRIIVTSTDLVSVGYDEETSTLEVEFKAGSVYQYSGVPLEVYQALMSAPSHGRYFNANIRKAYPYVRV